jgi:hypothetical protein
MNWKGYGRNLSRPKLRYIPALPGEIEENVKNLSQRSWSLGQDLNLCPLKYKAEVLTTRTRCSFSILWRRKILKYRYCHLYKYFGHRNTDFQTVISLKAHKSQYL